MKTLLSELFLYADLGVAEGLDAFAEHLESPSAHKPEILRFLKKTVAFSAEFGLGGNCFQNYLTYLTVRSENPFSLSFERKEGNASLAAAALADAHILREIYRFDLSSAVDPAFSELLTHLEGKEHIGTAAKRLAGLTKALTAAENDEEFLSAITDHYRNYGVGDYSLYSAFSLDEKGQITPIASVEAVTLEHLIGYDLQKKQLVENTEAFLKGKAANNVHLYGDAGTGKSTCVRALLNRYEGEGLRMVEVYRHQFEHLPAVIAKLKKRNYRFIIFIDDLSFEDHEVEYKYLKAVIEGGLSGKPENLLIYATSNRRHLIKESWKDKNDIEYEGEIHRSDTVEEKLSLAARFGIAIRFAAPDVKEYRDIVLGLAKEAGIMGYGEEELVTASHAWEIRHGGRSGRTAEQFISYLQGKEEDHGDT